MGELKNRVRVGFAMDKDVYKRLKAYADRTMVPMSRVVDKAVMEYLDRETESTKN